MEIVFCFVFLSDDFTLSPLGVSPAGAGYLKGRNYKIMTFGSLTCILVHVKSDFQAKESHETVLLIQRDQCCFSVSSIHDN